MCKVSIIMPMLNSIKYLHECIDSVVNQTLKDLEIIVVDAGSNDGTVEVLEEYVKNDNRIQIVHSEKKSMGYQYNLGISMARGEYIGFVESDDYILPNMYEVLYDKAKELDADWLKCNYYFIMDYPQRGRGLLPIREKRYMKYNIIFKPEEYPQQLIYENYMWNGIYKAGMLRTNNIALNETLGASFQDTGFVMQSFMVSDRSAYIDECLYCYRRDNPGSSAHMVKSIMFEWWEVSFLVKWFEYHKREKKIFFGPWYVRSVNLFDTFVEKISQEDDIPKNIIESAEMFGNFLLDNKPDINFVDDDVSSDKCFRLIQMSLFNGAKNFIKVKKDIVRWKNSKTEKMVQDLFEYKKIIIFGCGDNGMGLLSYLLRTQNMENILLCDNDKRFWDMKIMDVLVIPPKEIIKYPDYIVSIANVKNFDDILFECIELGVKHNMIQRAPDILSVRGTNPMMKGEAIPRL